MMSFNNRFIRIILLLALAAVSLGAVGCSRGSDRVDPLLAQGARLLRLGKIKQADTKIDAAIAVDPSRYSTYQTAMALYEAHRLYDRAAEFGQLALNRDRKSQLDRELSTEEQARLLATLGYFYQKAGRPSAAERAYKSALALAPDSPDLLNGLGYLYAEEGINLEEALRLLEKAVDIAPDKGYIIDSLGWARYKLKQYDEAVDDLKRAVELEPNEPELRYHLAVVYAEMGRRVEARIELNKALLLDSDMTQAADLLKTLPD